MFYKYLLNKKYLDKVYVPQGEYKNNIININRTRLKGQAKNKHLYKT